MRCNVINNKASRFDILQCIYTGFDAHPIVFACGPITKSPSPIQHYCSRSDLSLFDHSITEKSTYSSRNLPRGLALGTSEQAPDGSGYTIVYIEKRPQGSPHHAIFPWMERTLCLECYRYPRGQESESDGGLDIVGEARCSRRVDLMDVHTEYVLMQDKLNECCWPCGGPTDRKPAGRKIIVR